MKKGDMIRWRRDDDYWKNVTISEVQYDEHSLFIYLGLHTPHDEGGYVRAFSLDLMRVVETGSWPRRFEVVGSQENDHA